MSSLDHNFGYWSPLEKYVPDWRLISSVLRIKFFSRLYIWLFLVPVAARATQELPDILDVSNLLGPNALIVFEIPFNWLLLYVSAVLISISHLLYSVFCPKFIRAYDNPGEAVEKGLTAQAIRDFCITHLRTQLTRLTNREKFFLLKVAYRWGLDGDKAIQTLDQDSRETAGKMAILFSNTEIKPAPDGGIYNLQNPVHTISREHFVKLAFRSLERFLNTTSLKLRALITLALAVSFLLIAIVFLQSFVVVLTVFYENHIV